MNIDVGQGRNDMSQILAGRALKVTGGTIVNAGKEVDATTTNNGAAIHSYVKSHIFGSDERVYESAACNLTVATIRWNGKMSRHTLESTETGTTIAAAGDARLRAEGDLSGRAATLEAGETLRLSSGKQLTLVAGENQRSAETRHATKSGLEYYSLDASSQQVTLARTELSARHIELQSGENTVLGAVDVKADTLDIQASGKLVFQAQHGTDSASYQEAKGDAAWVSASGKGHVDQTTEYSRFNVGKLTVDAKGGVEVQIGGKDTPASLARQPGMGWVDQLVNDPALAGKVDWQRVQEAHDKWQYRQTGLGPVAAAVVTLVVGVATAGAGAAAAGTAGTATTAGTGMAGALGLSASATSTLGVVLQAGISTLASQATVSFVNNGGDLGAVLKEMGSSESLKAIATSMVTAGVIQGLSTSGLLPANLANATNGSAKFIDQLQRQLIDQTATGVVRSAVYGTDLGEELKQGILNAFLNTTAAQGAFAIGSNGPVSAGGNGNLDALATELAHGFLGCLSGAARAGSGDGCAPGALGAVAGHLASGTMPGLSPEQVLAVSQLAGGLAAGLAGQGDNGIYLGARTAANAVANNRLLHENEKTKIKELARGDSALERQLTEAACYISHCAAGKSDNDPAKADLQATDRAVAANANGEYTHALALLNTARTVGLFNYTDADRRLDDLNAIDPRNAGGLNAQERRSRDQNIQACRDAPSCIEDVNRRYDRMVSDRSETVMTTVNAIRAYNNCAAGDTACVSGSLAQMKTLQADLKAKGMTLADTERIGLNSYIASAEASLGNSYGALSAMAMGATGAKESEAGNGTSAATLPLGRGSTGRTVPISLSEQLAMAQAISSPGAGTVVPLRNGMTDSRWPASEGWVKMAQNINGVEIHYVRNTRSGAVDDFKFNK